MPFDTIHGNELLRSAEADFEGIALDMYRYQYEKNEYYRAFHDALKVHPDQVNTLRDIPFLPISFFKSHHVASFSGPAACVFDSSGTTGMTPSRHFVKDVSLYEAVSLQGFQRFFGDCREWAILALLPSYLERSTSSLVHMARMLMGCSGHPDNGFYLNEFALLQQKLMQLQASGTKVLLLGVTFALLDFATAFPMALSGISVMETGGMKGRREEWTRSQVHDFLKVQWQLEHIQSEYGMTELLSQAYALKDGIFQPIPTMQVLVRDIQDPLDTSFDGSGALNIIDLANVHSCAFIATEDIGVVHPDGTFEVSGRMDFAALRGCSLLAL